MSDFKIFAHGKNFDTDAYLKDSSIDFDHRWHHGDLRGCDEFIQDRHPTSGIEKILGDGRSLPIHEQDRLAADFLERFERDLAKLSRYPGVDTFILGLQYDVEMYPGLSGFCMSFSPRLMYQAIRAGIEPTFYVNLKDTNESQAM